MSENLFIQMYLAEIKELPPQVYNGLQVLLVLKGTIHVSVNTVEKELDANQLLLINQHDIFSLVGDQSNIVLVLKVPFEYLRKECEEILRHNYRCYSKDIPSKEQHKYDEIRKTLIYMMFTFSSLEEGYLLKTRVSLFQFFNYLLENFKTISSNEKITFTEKKDRRILSILSYIDMHYKQSISLNSLATKEYVSVHYLSRLFKKQVGVGFLDYVNIKRLESALKDLMYTNESILTIALQNGFANANAFISQFKKHYNQTPNTFRQEYQKKSLYAVNVQNKYKLLLIDEMGSLPELINYVRLYENDNVSVEQLVSSTKKIISLEQPSSQLKCFDRIVNIGKCSEALKSETKNQLILTQKNLNFRYVLFQGLFNDGIFKTNDSSMYDYYEYNQVIIFFEQIGLTPFIQLNISDLAKDKTDLSEAIASLSTFLSQMKKCFSRSYINNWKFEIVTTKEVSEEWYWSYYVAFYRVIKQFSKQVGVGILLLEDNETTETEELKHKLNTAINHYCPPDFITFHAHPNKVIADFIAIDSDSYQGLKDYHLFLTKRLKQVLAECNLASIPLYLTEWNTLTGKGFLEAGSFYRSALMIDAMLALSGQIAGLSFWLSEYNKEQITKLSVNNVLSLFHCHEAKRSIFFVLQAYFKLGHNIIFQNENIIVTENEESDIVIMAFNPCFFNPIHSMNYDFMKQQRKVSTYELQDIPSGLYRIKTFNFTMKFTFAINNYKVIHEIGSYQYNDEDVLAYVQNMAAPEFSLFEEEIHQNYLFKPKLSSNAVTLYHLKKIS